MIDPTGGLGMLFASGSVFGSDEGSQFGFVTADENAAGQLASFGQAGEAGQAFMGELQASWIGLGTDGINHDGDRSGSGNRQSSLDRSSGQAVERAEVPDDGVGMMSSDGCFLRVKSHGGPGSDGIGGIGTVVESDIIGYVMDQGAMPAHRIESG